MIVLIMRPRRVSVHELVYSETSRTDVSHGIRTGKDGQEETESLSSLSTATVGVEPRRNTTRTVDVDLISKLEPKGVHHADR
jgi:hypothetical protein